MIKGAIFDMDGLMFDTEAGYQKIWHDIAADRGIELDSDFTRRISGTSGEVAGRLVCDYYKVDDPSVITDECARRMLEDTADHIEIKPGLTEMLNFLRSEGIACAVASGSSREQIENNLRVSGLRDCFTAIVGGSELPCGKPDPGIFLCAAERLGCRSRDCLVFEDSPNGILAAHRAGAHPIMIPDLTLPSEDIKSVCEYIFEDMHQALAVLRAKYWCI